MMKNKQKHYFSDYYKHKTHARKKVKSIIKNLFINN